MLDATFFDLIVSQVRNGLPQGMSTASDWLSRPEWTDVRLDDAQRTQLEEAMASRKGLYRIAASRKPQLDTRLAKLNRRATKLEQPEVACVIERVEQEHITEACNACYQLAQKQAQECSACQGTRRVSTGAIKEWLHVRLIGLAPVVEGYVFLAKIEHTDAGNLLSRPAEDPKVAIPVPFKYREAKPDCDHCEIDRRRKDTFVLFELRGQKPEEVHVSQPETDPRYKQVGRNCLADFIRNPERAAEVLGIFSMLYEIQHDLVGGGEDDEEEFTKGGWDSGRYQGFDILHFLACANSSIRQEGWCSAAQAREAYERGSGGKPTTGDRALFIASPCRTPDRRTREEWARLQPTPDDFDKAKLVHAWLFALKAAETPDNRLSDYHHNLVVIAIRGLVEPKHSGLAASAVNGWQREQDRLARTSTQKKYPPSVYVGVVGDKIRDLRAAVIGVSPIPNDFDVTTLITFRTENGEILKWFSAGEHTVDCGQEYMITATVKKHSEWRGEKQTTIARAVLDPVTIKEIIASDEQYDYQACLRADDSVVIIFKTKRAKKFKPLTMATWFPEEHELRLRTGYSLPEGRTDSFLMLLASNLP